MNHDMLSRIAFVFSITMADPKPVWFSAKNPRTRNHLPDCLDVDLLAFFRVNHVVVLASVDHSVLDPWRRPVLPQRAHAISCVGFA